MITLLAFVAQAHAKELVDQVESQNLDKLVDELVDQLSNRLLQALPLDDTDLDDTVMGKAANMATATRPTAVLPGHLRSPQFSAVSAVAPRSSEVSPELPLGRRELAAAVATAVAGTAMQAKASWNDGGQFNGEYKSKAKNGPIPLPFLFAQPTKSRNDGARGKL